MRKLKRALSAFMPTMLLLVIFALVDSGDIIGGLELKNFGDYKAVFNEENELLPHEAVVTDFADFKKVLSENNGITTVYLGADITMERTGVRINSQKEQVIIDGVNPYDMEQIEPHTLTDYDSGAQADTIFVNSAGVKSLTLRNMTIVGKNFYGPASVLDAAALSGMVLTYERVNYNGPQLGYHRQGTVRIVDCAARIHGNNGIPVGQELAEAKHLVFEGTSLIDSAISAYAVFWLPLGGSFRLENSAALTLLSPNTSSAYGVFSGGATASRIDITIGSGAIFDAEISGVIADNTYSTISSLTVQEGGEFRIRTTKSATEAVLRMAGALTIEKDAVFQIIADTPQPALITLAGGTFVCNDPLDVLLINSGRCISAVLSAGEIYIDAQHISYWNVISDGGVSNPPLYRWEKQSKANFVIAGRLSIGTNGNFTDISSNFEPDDSPGLAPSAASFSMVEARILAFGKTAKEGGGTPELLVPALLEFQSTRLLPHEVIVKRQDPNWAITVLNAEKGWKLYARLESELTPDLSGKPSLTGALVFVDEQGRKSPLGLNAETLIFAHGGMDAEERSTIIWRENEGVLLSVKPGRAFADTQYRASISWTLVNAP